MSTLKRIRTVLYGDQRLSAGELEILHTPTMQRLYGLRQLGLTDRIFIDASHARIHHLVGVLQQVDRLVTAIVSNLRKSQRNLRIGAFKENQDKSAAVLAYFVEERRPVIRLIGLLHDITHAPFGHTVEDEIRLVGTKHDEPARQADAFYRLVCQLIAWLSTELGDGTARVPAALKPFLSQGGDSPLPDPLEVGRVARSIFDSDPVRLQACLRLPIAEMAELFAHLRCAMTALLYLEALHKQKLEKKDLPADTEYPFQIALRIALQGTSFENLLDEFEFQARREAFMLDIVGNTVCADLLDYAKRDSHFAGLQLDYDAARIAENFTLVSFDASSYELTHPDSETGGPRPARMPAGIADPFAGWCLRTAISLFSHKYRTDVPSELMNLLNVRFYLYERAIYHPTKCAAGSMLGTALQLLGWRSLDTDGKAPDLPPHLRFVTDEVFLHDIRTSLDFLLQWIETVKEEQIALTHVELLAKFDCIHSGLIRTILSRRVDQSVKETEQELGAARFLLDRLAARRYFRPIFRALPSSAETRLQANAETLADIFRRPDSRYDAERRIEMESGLPLGTVTIHCPTRHTAKKIANVLLTKPSETGSDEICKLKDIGALDKDIFGEHEKAVKAVERMYGSMWRLTVYLAPEYLVRYSEIGKVAGRVIFETVDPHGQFHGRADTYWRNDPHLERELAAKLDIHSIANPPGGAVRVRTEVDNDSTSLLPSDAHQADETPKHSPQPERMDDVLAVFKTYAKRPRRKDVEEFRRRYAPAVSALTNRGFEEVIAGLEGAIKSTQELGERGTTVHHGYQFDKLMEILDELLAKHRVRALPKAPKDLFGGSQ